MNRMEKRKLIKYLLDIGSTQQCIVSVCNTSFSTISSVKNDPNAQACTHEEYMGFIREINADIDKESEKHGGYLRESGRPGGRVEKEVHRPGPRSVGSGRRTKQENIEHSYRRLQGKGREATSVSKAGGNNSESDIPTDNNRNRGIPKLLTREELRRILSRGIPVDLQKRLEELTEK